MLKNSLSSFQSRIGDLIKPLPLHPNHLTLLSVLLAAAGAWLAWQHDPLSLLLFLLSFAIDGLDGALARAKNLTSAFGAYLDGMCDRLVEFFSLLPFLFTPVYFIPALLILFFGSVMTAFSKAYADHREVCDAKTAAKLTTLLPRTERAIGLFVALLLFVQNLSDFLLPLLWILAAGSVLSFLWLQYVIFRAGEKSK